jgi:hypothetical protein
MNGIVMMMAEGGAERESRARRLMKEAMRVAGRWLGEGEEREESGSVCQLDGQVKVKARERTKMRGKSR